MSCIPGHLNTDSRKSSKTVLNKPGIGVQISLDWVFKCSWNGCSNVVGICNAVEKLDKQIKLLYEQHTDCFIYDSLTGAGLCMAPRLLVAMGDDRTRHQSAADIQKYGEIAPVIEASSKQPWTRWRYDKSRQTMVISHYYIVEIRTNYHCAQSKIIRLKYMQKVSKKLAEQLRAYYSTS